MSTNNQNSVPAQFPVTAPAAKSIARNVSASMRNHIELLVGMSARSDAVTIITKLSTPNRMAENTVSAR
jgi:hypothetical protein